MRWRAGLVLIVAAVTACGGRSADVYPPDVVQNFMKACTTRSEERDCRCAVDALQQHFTADEFHAAESRILAGELPKPMVDAVAGCRH